MLGDIQQWNLASASSILDSSRAATWSRLLIGQQTPTFSLRETRERAEERPSAAGQCSQGPSCWKVTVSTGLFRGLDDRSLIGSNLLRPMLTSISRSDTDVWTPRQDLNRQA